MKIGLVAPGGFDRSGRERVIPVFLGLIERLACRHEVHVYTLRQYREPTEYSLLGATVHNLGYRDGRAQTVRQVLHAIDMLRHEHRRRSFDVLHGLWANDSGLSVALAGRWLRIASVVSVLGGELVALPEIGYGAQLRMTSRLVVAATLRLAGAVTVATAYMLGPLRKIRSDTRLVPLGVDCNRFTPPESPPPGPPWRLLHVASLNRVKDQTTLLRAFARIHAADAATHLDILGEDTLNGEIQRLAVTLGLQDAVTFHGFQPLEVVIGWMQRSHLLLHSSRSEAGQMVYLEAAACGLPSVGTAVGHIADQAPQAALAVPIGDAAALADAALDLLHEDACRQAVARCALAFARTYDADRTARQFEALYEEIEDTRHPERSKPR